MTFKIWDFAGQSSYGLTHQFFLSEFSLNCIVVDMNRYAIDEDAVGRIDVIAYHLEQAFGIDIREHLPVIKEPIIQSDQIYRECWQQICSEGATSLRDIEAILRLQDKATYVTAEGRQLLAASEASARRLLGSVDPLLQPETDGEIIRQRAVEAQQSIKNTLAPKSEWASTPFDQAFAATHSKEDATRLRTATRESTPEIQSPYIAAIYDPGVKSSSRMEEKATFKYAGRFERVRDVARVAVQCSSVADLLLCFEYLSDVFRVLCVENRFARPTALGWRDIQVFVEIPLAPPATVHIVEVQLQLVEFATARLRAHGFYRVLRAKLGEALRDVECDVDRVQNYLLDQITNPVDGAAVFDQEIQSWIDMLQNRTASSTGAKFLLVATKVDLCPEKYEQKAKAMIERVRHAERARMEAIEAEIRALQADESRVQDAKTIKRHRLTRKGGMLKAGALEQVSKKRKREFQRLLQTRPILVDDKIYCVSARTGLGVAELTEACVRAANRENFPFFGEETPKCDLDLADEVDELRVHATPYLHWDDYVSLARKCGVEAKHVAAVTRGLRRRGNILHFAETTTDLDSVLSTLVFTDCQWVIDVMKAIVRHDLESLLDDDEVVALGRGVLKQSTAKRLWSSSLAVDDRVLQGLEGLLLKFELVVPMTVPGEEDRAYLVPAFLPPELGEAAHIEWERAGPRNGHESNISVGVRIEFRFGAPRGFFERCIVRLLKIFQPCASSKAATTSNVVCWKHGLLRMGNPWLRFELVRINGIDVIDVTSRYTVGDDDRDDDDETSKNRALALTTTWAINNSAKFCAGELLTEWPGVIFALKVVCPYCCRRNLPGASTWAIEEFLHSTTTATISCEVCKEQVPLELCVPPLELAVKDVKRIRRIAARWKEYQHRTAEEAGR